LIILLLRHIFIATKNELCNQYVPTKKTYYTLNVSVTRVPFFNDGDRIYLGITYEGAIYFDAVAFTDGARLCGAL
jgi:hypothetical protein